LIEYHEQDRDKSDEPETEGRGNTGNSRGSKRGGRLRESNENQDNQFDGSEIQGREKA